RPLTLSDHLTGLGWSILPGTNVAAVGLMKARWGDASPLVVTRSWVLADGNYRSGYDTARSRALTQAITEVTARANAGTFAGTGWAAGMDHPYAKALTDQRYAAGGADVGARFSYAFTVSGSKATVTV